MLPKTFLQRLSISVANRQVGAQKVLNLKVVNAGAEPNQALPGGESPLTTTGGCNQPRV